MDRWHRSIMVGEIVDLLRLTNTSIVMDATFGEGGHSEAFLARGADKVWAFDRDEWTLKRYLTDGAARTDPRLHLVHGTFADNTQDLPPDLYFDAALADLGVSTRQLLEPARGFSFAQEGPLDMRMDSTSGPTLLDRLAETSEEELSSVLFNYAQVPGSRSLARRILQRVRENALRTTLDLAWLCGPKRTKTHPATTVFMALRMWVNDELGQVQRGIPEIWKRVKPGGRLAVLTFHSGEDALVKKMFRRWAGLCVCRLTPCVCPRKAEAKLVTRKPALPSAEELDRNPRARSAKLRCVEKAVE